MYPPYGGGGTNRTIAYITKLINKIFKMYTFRLSNKTQTGIWGCSRQLDRLKRQFQLGHVRWLFISSVTSSNMAAHTWQSTEFSS